MRAGRLGPLKASAAAPGGARGRRGGEDAGTAEGDDVETVDPLVEKGLGESPLAGEAATHLDGDDDISGEEGEEGGGEGRTRRGVDETPALGCDDGSEGGVA